MQTTTNNRFDDLAIKGRVVYPTDSDWDVAHQAFSTLVDQRPEAMVFPVDESDVVTIVNYAREHGVRIAPQATAHNAGALGDLDDTIVVQTSQMQSVSIDPVAHRVSVDGQPLRDAAGSDVDDDGAGLLTEPRMYQLVRQRGPIADRLFTIEFQDRGAEAFAFTFG